MLRLATAGGAGHGTTRPPGDAAVPASRTPSRPTPSRTRPTGARPTLSAAEMQALREALALRQTLAAGQTLSPEQAAAVRVATAVAARTGPARTTAGRPAATGRPAPKRSPGRKPASRTGPARPKRARAATTDPATPRTGPRWSTRLKVVALSTVLLPAVASLALPGGQDTPPGGPLDVTALALTAQSTLLESAGEYRRLEQEAAARSTELRQAHEAQAA